MLDGHHLLGQRSYMTNSRSSESQSLDQVLRSLDSEGRLVHVEDQPGAPARTCVPGAKLPPGILDNLGIDALWSHQGESFDRLTSGESTVVVSGTGSGKSLCYQLPIVDAIVTHPGSSALVIYPTKALARGQLRSFESLAAPGLVAAAYDADSTRDQRLWARRNSNVILTNPEMLHLGILPNHQRWSTFLSRLKYVVVDELHVFRGIFGTNVAHVLRRLRRVCAHHGAKPTFAFTSATVGEPERLAGDLIGDDSVSAVVDDGSPRAPKLIAIWSGTGNDPRTHTSPNHESAMLAGEFISRGHRTLTFCRSRQGTETVTSMIKERLRSAPSLAASVSAYRGGYLADERREVEDLLFDGELGGVVATSALELGVDVGNLDVAVINGFPGTIASFRQQIGRVGRREDSSLAVLVSGKDQLDEWFKRHPSELMNRPPERAVINPENPFVLRPHLACAAHELALSAEHDTALWPDGLDSGVRDLVRVDLVNIRNRRAAWAHSRSPAREISLRSGGGAEVRILDENGKLIGTIDQQRAPKQVHPGARYLHQGQAWEITSLDLERRQALARPDERGPIRSRALSTISIDIVEQFEHRELGSWTLHLGSVEIGEVVTRYQIRDRAGRVIEDEPLDLAKTQMQTTALWLCVPPGTIDITKSRLPGALHAIEHASIGVLPLFAICDRWDVGGVSSQNHHQTNLPTVFIHDAMPGGAGVAALGYDRAAEVFASARDIIKGCDCANGCPGCVQSPKCGSGNEPLDKQAAATVLEGLGN